jgi:hypothetical protein
MFALLISLAPPPATRTETIQLIHFPAGKLATVGVLEREDLIGGLIDGRTRILLPDGIAAWTVDDSRNTVTLTGTDKAIQEFKNIVRLVDVPPAQIQVAVRVLQVQPADLADVRFDLIHNSVVSEDGRHSDRTPEGLATGILDEKQAAALAARPATFATDVAVVNNGTLRLRVPRAGQPPAFSVTPRLNGDGTITLLMPFGEVKPAETPGQYEGLFALHRLYVGQTILVFLKPPGLAVLVTVREVRRENTAPNSGE